MEGGGSEVGRGERFGREKTGGRISTGEGRGRSGVEVST